MAEQGTGAELQLSSRQARANIQSLMEELEKLEKKVESVNSRAITLSGSQKNANLTALSEQIENLSRHTDIQTKKITKAVGTAAGKAIGHTHKVGEEVKEVAENSAKAVEKAAKRSVSAITTVGNGIKSIGGFGRQLNDSITQMANSLVAPLRGIFSSIRSFVTTSVNESIGQIEKLELAEVGLANHFKNDGAFNLEEYIKKIRSTAERTQGLSAGDLADYISQLAPLSHGDSQTAFDATMGALKVIKYGGGDTTTDMMSIIKNIRDVVSKGKAYQMDLNQFNRAAPLLATILKAQGMDQFVKEGEGGALSLNITKKNYQKLIDAFAQLNYNQELNDTFDAMSTTLSGLIEQTKQSIQNDLIDLANYSKDGQKSLLDLWKDFLIGTNNSSLRNTIREGLQGLTSSVVSFIQSLDVKEIFESAVEGLKELGSYVKDTLLPALRSLLGVDEGASPTEVIKSLINSLVSFGKGVINGMKSFISILNTAKQVLDRVFGENTGAILMTLGWVKGFSKVGWDLVSGLGSIVSTVGKVNKTLSKLFGTSAIQNVGLGLIGGGLASTATDMLFSNGENWQNKVGGNIISSLSTGLGLALWGQPIWGAVIGGVQLAAKTLYDIATDTNALKKKLVDEQNNNLTEVQKHTVDTILSELAQQDAPIYQPGEQASEEAAALLQRWAADGHITDTSDPQKQALQRAAAREYYQQQYQNQVGRLKLLGLEDQYFVQQTGKTKLNSDTANIEANAEALKKYWEYLVKYQRVQAFADWDKVDTEGSNAGDNILQFITGHSIADPGSVENLQDFLKHLNEVDAAIEDITQRDTQLEIEAILQEGDMEKIANAIKASMESAGFKLQTISGESKWVTEAVVQAALEAREVDDIPELKGTRVHSIGGGKQGIGFNSEQRRSTLSETSNQTLQNAYGFDAVSTRQYWQGFIDKIHSPEGLGKQETEQYNSSLDDIISRAATVIFWGGTLSNEQKELARDALISRYENWNNVLKGIDPEVAMVLVHGLQDLIGEETGVAVQMLRDGFDFGRIGINGDGAEAYREAAQTNPGITAYYDDLWRDIRRKYLEVQARYKAAGGPITPPSRPAKPLFYAWGGSSRGVDTIPAMLSPGEFVERASAVKKAGLSVMTALNQGDLRTAYRLLGARLNTSYDNRRYGNTHDDHSQTTQNNFVRILNQSGAARNTGYRGLVNRMTMR